MIKRIVEISGAGTFLSVKHGQLIIRQDKQEKGHIPCEDVGVLLIDHAGTTYTHSVFTELLKHGTAVILCGYNHHPSGMLLPIESNNIQTERFRRQIAAKEPVKKQLWKQIVRAKILHQAKLVRDNPDIYRILKLLAKKVRSGDADNIEAQASKKFWQAYLQEVRFCRNTDGPPPNNMLNYGYMVMRAAVARAICSAGLLPSLGIHHRNRYNAFCLADDVMEPFRGFVEEKVRHICRSNGVPDELTQSIKAGLLEVLYNEVKIGDFAGPLLVGLHRTAASLQRCFEGLQKEIDLPEI